MSAELDIELAADVIEICQDWGGVAVDTETARLILAAVRARLSAARDAALESAATVCDQQADFEHSKKRKAGTVAAETCALLIRALRQRQPGDGETK